MVCVCSLLDDPGWMNVWDTSPVFSCVYGKALFQVSVSLLLPVPSTVDSAISSADSAILCQPEPLHSSHDQVVTTASKDHPVRISKSRWEKWAYKIPR